jgi:hypothetical protein
LGEEKELSGDPFRKDILPKFNKGDQTMQQAITFLTAPGGAINRGAGLWGKCMRHRGEERSKGARRLAAIIALIIGAILGMGQPTSAESLFPPSITISDAVKVERNTGGLLGGFARFAVQLGYTSSLTVKVNYATVNYSAVAPGDYNATSGTLTFSPGETNKLVFVGVKDDILNEPNETFMVKLSSPQNANLDDSTGIGLILDDDPGKLTIFDVTKFEGEGPFSFEVRLSRPYSQTVKVNYATANGTAVAPGDYTATNGTLTFSPGETKKWVTVNVVNSYCQSEGDEQFKVVLSNPTHAPIADAVGIGTILKVPCPK